MFIDERKKKSNRRFKDYILTLSILCRGTIDEKLRWIFRLYDQNGEGQLTREVITSTFSAFLSNFSFFFSYSIQNVRDIIVSLYDLLGPSVQPRVDESEIQQHVDEIFQVNLIT